jgi:hypothetical protein
MTDKIKSLGAARALKSHDNRQWTPVECLIDCIDDIQSGAVVCDKLFVIRVNVDEADEKFGVGYSAAHIKASEILAALEIAKAIILQEMGYVE